MIYIGLGANLPSRIGSPLDTLQYALKQLPVVRMSSFYQTPPFPVSDQPDYINAAAALNFEKSADQLLVLLHQIEASCGRLRIAINEARPLDLDILDFNGVIKSENPVLPHPRMTKRAFVLVPLQEIAPDWIDPVTKQPIHELVAHLPPYSIKKL